LRRLVIYTEQISRHSHCLSWNLW